MNDRVPRDTLANMTVRKPSQVGHLLRYWRNARKLSQLDVALAAGISGRHLSFVETGRARPSQEMILRLSDVLDVPFRERNGLLAAGGFAAHYRETALGDDAMAPVKRAVDFILDHHHPYPAVALDRSWTVLQLNTAAARVMGHFVAAPIAPPFNTVRALFDERGFRPFIVNWEQVASALIQRLHRDAIATGDEALRRLLAEMLAVDGVPDDWRSPNLEAPLEIILPITLRRDDLELSLFSTIATLGTPQDVTAQELQIETFFPADEASDAAVRRLAGD